MRHILTRKIILSASILFLPVFVYGEKTKTIMNPFTGQLDYITRLDTTTLIAGTGISISCTGGVCTITNTGGGGGTTYVLMEDATIILAEDGSKILTEQ
jgi:hypothetical protein